LSISIIVAVVDSSALRYYGFIGSPAWTDHSGFQLTICANIEFAGIGDAGRGQGLIFGQSLCYRFVEKSCLILP
jgi:hypothetical protein